LEAEQKVRLGGAGYRFYQGLGGTREFKELRKNSSVFYLSPSSFQDENERGLPKRFQLAVSQLSEGIRDVETSF
jgi:hypothetical protein